MMLSDEQKIECERWILIEVIKAWPTFKGFRFAIEADRDFSRQNGVWISIEHFDGDHNGARVFFGYEPIQHQKEAFVQRQIRSTIRAFQRKGLL